jgi:hypothetical protein
METTDEENLLAVLGNPEIRYQASTSWGGGGSVSVLVHAAVAIAAGMADTVLVFRSRARGKTSVFGKDALQGPVLGAIGRPALGLEPVARAAWPRERVPGDGDDHPSPHDRLRHDGGSLRRGGGRAARARRAQSQRRDAQADDHRGPSRLALRRRAAAPVRLQHRDRRRVRLIVTSTERARDLRQRPAIIHGGALAAGSHHIRLSTLFARNRDEDSAVRVGRQLWANTGLAPRDVDAFFLLRLLHLVRRSWRSRTTASAPRGEGGPFVTGGALRFDGGRLPTNTNGGQLSEAFIHGVNNNLEAVRQIRGTSTSQVADCELVLLAGANTDPTGAVILRR